jgi:hypothetical protein
MALVMSEVLGRPVGFQQLSVADNKAAMMAHGVSEAWAQGVADMIEAQNDGIYGRPPRTPQAAAPTSFRQWCADTLMPAILACGRDKSANQHQPCAATQLRNAGKRKCATLSRPAG